MNKGVVQITFANHTFNVELKEGESIDLRLKNENGYIYMGKANDEKDRNHKATGYSTAGLIEEKKQGETENIKEFDSNSAIYNVLNSKERKEQQTESSVESSNEPDENIHEKEDEIKIQKSNEPDDISEEHRVSTSSDNEEPSIESAEKSEEDDKQESILRRYVPIEEDEE
ncbi:hypothetical protein [Staphylococcus aureus]|uniref:hypothetical protein n=1 Tax=Staphylococcus aureus TaxID=1280 RepID=UPI0027E893F1|nr:hypothetical protein [Staphylococcus aureus]MDQ7134572.1 hypothetical protein [Staphylococcus aureus]